MEIAQRLRAIREAKRLSQETVAKALYVTRQTISRWEQGHTLPNIYALQDLAQLYGCSLAELVGEAHVSQKPAVAEEKSMRSKMNWPALFGLIWFNLIVALAVVITVFALVLSLWVIVLSFIVAPALVVGGKLLFALAIPWWQLPIAAVFCGVGVGLWQPAMRLSHYVWEIFVHYLRYNRRSVYSE